MRACRGFSLVEITVVISLISILAGLFISHGQFAVRESRATACEKNRVLLEDTEQVFHHKEKRYSHALEELVDKGYVTRARCPEGGVLTWAVTDPTLPFEHQTLVCSRHGPKTRIRAWVPVTATEAYAFADSFDGPIAGGWTQTKGRWFETIELAASCNLQVLVDLRNQPSLIPRKEQVTWTRLAFARV